MIDVSRSDLLVDLGGKISRLPLMQPLGLLCSWVDDLSARRDLPRALEVLATHARLATHCVLLGIWSELSCDGKRQLLDIGLELGCEGRQLLATV